MRLLFAISIASFCTVLWLALALARRIRRDQLGRAQPAVKAPAMEFFEAGEFRTPRALRLNQQLSHSGTRRTPLDSAERPVLATPARSSFAAITEAAPIIKRAHVAAPTSVDPARAEAVVIGSRLHFVMPERAHLVAPLPHDRLPAEISRQRKSPQPDRSGAFRRVDLSHYNEEMGDLTDPYTHSSRLTGAQPSAKNA